MNRDQRARIAAETVAILREGAYRTPSGLTVNIRAAVEAAIHRSSLITPEVAARLRLRAEAAVSGNAFRTTFEVSNEPTLVAARRLVNRFGAARVAALNFASAKNPGGGFLSGSQAQEESLARASALYPCLSQHATYYEANRSSGSPLYTDHLIVSPEVPVFREEDGELLEQPWALTIITAPAPNAGAIAKNEPASLELIEPTFRRRLELVLAAAATYGQAALVLGAWGCGVFGNDPRMVARLFAEFLLGDGLYAKAFERVTFAVLDRQGETLAAFADVFAPTVREG